MMCSVLLLPLNLEQGMRARARNLRSSLVNDTNVGGALESLAMGSTDSQYLAMTVIMHHTIRQLRTLPSSIYYTPIRASVPPSVFA